MRISLVSVMTPSWDLTRCQGQPGRIPHPASQPARLDLVQQLNEKSQVKQIKKTKKADKKPFYILACEQKLQERFGTMALIQQRGDKGKIEIEYMDESDLMRILDLLQIQA